MRLTGLALLTDISDPCEALDSLTRHMVELAFPQPIDTDPCAVTVVAWRSARQLTSLQQVPQHMMGPHARRLPVILHSWERQGELLAVKVVHYPWSLRQWHRVTGAHPFARAHRQAQRGEALTVHLAGVVRPTSAALGALEQLPRLPMHQLRLLAVTEPVAELWTEPEPPEPAAARPQRGTGGPGPLLAQTGQGAQMPGSPSQSLWGRLRGALPGGTAQEVPEAGASRGDQHEQPRGPPVPRMVQSGHQADPAAIPAGTHAGGAQTPGSPSRSLWGRLRGALPGGTAHTVPQAKASDVSARPRCWTVQLKASGALEGTLSSSCRSLVGHHAEAAAQSNKAGPQRAAARLWTIISWVVPWPAWRRAAAPAPEQPPQSLSNAPQAEATGLGRHAAAGGSAELQRGARSGGLAPDASAEPVQPASPPGYEEQAPQQPQPNAVVRVDRFSDTDDESGQEKEGGLPDMLWGELYAARQRHPLSLLWWRRDDVCELLLQEGHAMLPDAEAFDWLQVDPVRVHRLQQAEAAAMRQGLGLWARPSWIGLIAQRLRRTAQQATRRA
eukprot:jgi/Astpho2/6487/Aster-x1378